MESKFLSIQTRYRVNDKTGATKLVDTGEYDTSKVVDQMKYIVGYFAGAFSTLLETMN